MARIVYDPGVRLISGRVGGFVFRLQNDNSSVVAERPLTNPDRALPEARLQQMQRFREASARSRNLITNATIRQIYEQLLVGRGSTARLWATVMGDVLKAPQIKTIDLSQYRGVIGDTIRILAQDNVGVYRMTLAVHDNTSGQDLETGEMAAPGTLSETVEWAYITTTALPDPSLNHVVEIRAAAYDLAGNETTSSLTLGT